jgi:hypothetical protein
MKLFYFLVCVLITTFLFAQEEVKDSTALVYLQKAEFNVFGLGVNYEVPVAKALVLDSGVGFTSGVRVVGDKISYEKKIYNPCFYFKSELKYYYNRSQRIANGFSVANNEGSYFALQTKYTTPRLLDNEYSLSNVIMSEIHWGIQRTVYEDFLINLHIGLGIVSDFTTRQNSNYTAVGVKVAYVFAAKKINFKEALKW